MSTRIFFAAILCLAAASRFATADEPPLTGRVLSAAGKPIVGALVLACDQKTGLPIAQETFEPIQVQNLEKLASDVTNERGEFAIASPQPGVYRLIAQSWESAKKPVEKPLEVNGTIVHLHGIVEQVQVPLNPEKKLVIRPLGKSTLTVSTDPLAPNDDTLLVVSRGPLAADPVLGFAAWSGEFMPQMLAWNRMPRGTTTIHGLPDGKIHLAVFANDNNPGFGGDHATLERDGQDAVNVKFLASWSDGHKKPPASLQSLVKKVQTFPEGEVLRSVSEQIPEWNNLFQGAKDPITAMARLSKLFDRQIALPSGEKVRFKDLMAANAYAGLLQAEEERLKRAQQAVRAPKVQEEEPAAKKQ